MTFHTKSIYKCNQEGTSYDSSCQVYVAATQITQPYHKCFRGRDQKQPVFFLYEILPTFPASRPHRLGCHNHLKNDLAKNKTHKVLTVESLPARLVGTLHATSIAVNRSGSTKRTFLERLLANLPQIPYQNWHWKT